MRWTYADFFKGPPEADIYADYLAARYAGMVGDPVEAAEYYRRAFEREPAAEGVLETAVFSALIAADMPSAIRTARHAEARGGADTQSARLVLAIDDVVNGQGQRAMRRLDGPTLGVLNAELSAYLRAWLTASVRGDVDGALAMLSAPVSRRTSPAEAACMQGLILMNAGRGVEALERLGQCQGPPPMEAMRARLAASASAPPKLGVAEGSALAVLLSSSSGLARSSPQIMTIRMTMALHLDKRLDTARLLLADALDEQDRQTDALRLIAEAPADSPHQPDFQIQKARLHLALDQKGQASEAARRAAQATSRREIRLAAADIEGAAGELASAETLFNGVIADDGAAGDWRALFARANVRHRLHRWPEAEADAKAALALEPNRPELLNFIGYGWVDRGERLAEGLDLIRRAAAQSPGQGYIIDSLGWAHYRLGEYDKAVEYLEQAAALSPGSPEIIEHLGDAYWRVGRTVEAGYEWRAALALTTEGAAADALRGKLAHGLTDPPLQAMASTPSPSP